MNITVAGLGYVGTSCAALFSIKHKVIAYDIDHTKVEMLNARRSPIEDREVEKRLRLDLDLHATTDRVEAYSLADFVVVATPTNYDPQTNYFDTRFVEEVISDALKINPQVTVVIKSTIPVGFVDELRSLHGTNQIFFSPEFLREGRALLDNLYPSRIVVGSRCKHGKLFAELLKDLAQQDDVPVYTMGTREAEMVKLAANTYLAMRVSYFNELDSLCLTNELNSQEILDGTCSDPRIGHEYNNPSFGYGGYCLPKDSKQMLANFGGTPQALVNAIVESNKKRKNLIADFIDQQYSGVLGVYRLAMKAGSDNFRDSAIQDVIAELRAKGRTVYIYEPLLKATDLFGAKRVETFSELEALCDLIITNRVDAVTEAAKTPVFSRDVFREN